jgi:uncharacterized protein (DUF433 family)
MEDMSVLHQYISVNKDIAGGVPVFRGTDVAVKLLFDHLRDSTLYEFLLEYPEVSAEQAEAIMELVAANDFL